MQLAGRQFNRIARWQLFELGFSARCLTRRVSAERLVPAGWGVFAFAPLLNDDPRGDWMAATLTAQGSVLSHLSAAAAYGIWGLQRVLETVTRPGSGGPERWGSVVVHRSRWLDGDCTILDGIPITTIARTLVDIAPIISQRALARAVREAIRLEHITHQELGDALGRYRGRRGVRKLAAVVSRYAGLPLERARSGAEIRAMEILRDAGRTLPKLNHKVAGEEADLSWARERLIIEIDGGPFHQDVGEDARKQAIWERAGWTVRRLSSDDVYELPHVLLTLAPNVGNTDT